MSQELDDILGLRSAPAPSIQSNLSGGDGNTGGVITKHNGAIVFIGVLLLINGFVLSFRVGRVWYYDASGSYNETLEIASALDEGFERVQRAAMESPLHDGHYDEPDAYSSIAEEIENQKKQSKIETLVGLASFIAGGVLLSLKGRFCSECGGKIGTTTAKLCGNCGARFELNQN